jgi:ankyrin repeat protein
MVSTCVCSVGLDRFHKACHEGRLEAVKAATNTWPAALQVSGKDDQASSLHLDAIRLAAALALLKAASRGQTAIVKYLLDMGAQVDATNEVGWLA